MAEYKANKKYFELGEKKDFRSKGGFTKHGLLVAGYNINLSKLPKGREGCLDDVNEKTKTKQKNKKESK